MASQIACSASFTTSMASSINALYIPRFGSPPVDPTRLGLHNARIRMHLKGCSGPEATGYVLLPAEDSCQVSGAALVDLSKIDTAAVTHCPDFDFAGDDEFFAIMADAPFTQEECYHDPATATFMSAIENSAAADSFTSANTFVINNGPFAMTADEDDVVSAFLEKIGGDLTNGDCLNGDMDECGSHNDGAFLACAATLGSCCVEEAAPSAASDDAASANHSYTAAVAACQWDLMGDAASRAPTFVPMPAASASASASSASPSPPGNMDAAIDSSCDCSDGDSAGSCCYGETKGEIIYLPAAMANQHLQASSAVPPPRPCSSGRRRAQAPTAAPASRDAPAFRTRAAQRKVVAQLPRTNTLVTKPIASRTRSKSRRCCRN